MSNIAVKKEFHEFGKYIQIVAILTILSITTGITGLIASIFVFVALGCIKRANYLLNNSSLDELRSNYIKGFISKICGMIILITGAGSLVLFFFIPFPVYIAIPLSIILIGSGLLFIYIGVAAEVKAWKSLKIFFLGNSG